MKKNIAFLQKMNCEKIRVADANKGKILLLTEDEFLDLYYVKNYEEHIISSGSGSNYNAIVIFTNDSVVDAYVYAITLYDKPKINLKSVCIYFNSYVVTRLTEITNDYSKNLTEKIIEIANCPIFGVKTDFNGVWRSDDVTICTLCDKNHFEGTDEDPEYKYVVAYFDTKLEYIDKIINNLKKLNFKHISNDYILWANVYKVNYEYNDLIYNVSVNETINID